MRTLTPYNQDGFTLIELIIAVLIVGLLAGIAVPRLAKAWDDAKAAACQANMKQLEAALDMYYFEHGEYPAGAGEDGLQQLSLKSIPKCPKGKQEYTYHTKDLETEGYLLNCDAHKFTITGTKESFDSSKSND